MKKDELLKRLNGLKADILAIQIRIRDSQEEISENLSNDDISFYLDMINSSINDLMNNIGE